MGRLCAPSIEWDAECQEKTAAFDAVVSFEFPNASKVQVTWMLRVAEEDADLWTDAERAGLVVAQYRRLSLVGSNLLIGKSDDADVHGLGHKPGRSQVEVQRRTVGIVGVGVFEVRAK